jgi:Tol biopolymer transport system component
VEELTSRKLVLRLLVGGVLLFALGSDSFARTPTGPTAQAPSELQGLTFVRGEYLQNSYIMRTRADGSVMRFVRGFAPAWSPDGRDLAYIALRPTAPSAGMETDIFIVSTDGQHRRRLTNDPSQESDIEWSPTGAEIAYSDAVPRGGSGDVFVADRSGRRHRRLTQTDSTCEYPTGWSRDGRWVQASTCITDARSELRASGGKKRLPSTPRGSLSPDGRWIAYVTNDGHTSLLYVADADGENPRLIASIEGSRLAWSPDGRRLAYEGDARGGCGATEYRAQVFLIAPEPGSTPMPRQCINAWERSPTWQPVRR